MRWAFFSAIRQFHNRRSTAVRGQQQFAMFRRELLQTLMQRLASCCNRLDWTALAAIGESRQNVIAE